MHAIESGALARILPGEKLALILRRVFVKRTELALPKSELEPGVMAARRARLAKWMAGG